MNQGFSSLCPCKGSNLPTICHAVDQTFNKKLFQQETISKNIYIVFFPELVRAGEKIKYRSVGHSVCHIYFASSIETLDPFQFGGVWKSSTTRAPLVTLSTNVF